MEKFAFQLQAGTARTAAGEEKFAFSSRKAKKEKKKRGKVEKWKICLSTAVSQGHLGRLAE